MSCHGWKKHRCQKPNISVVPKRPLAGRLRKLPAASSEPLSGLGPLRQAVLLSGMERGVTRMQAEFPRLLRLVASAALRWT